MDDVWFETAETHEPARAFETLKSMLEVALDRTYIGSVERGERNISLINICKIAKTLGVSPSTLIDF
jgi:transcriptional regulator with XRE-family HTH domain